MMKKVLGIGNALVDIMTKLENDSLLDKLSLPKGSMQLIDKFNASQIEEHTSDLNKQQTSGGSAANTIHGLAHLGIETGFIGKVGNDDFGKFFQMDMEKNNIRPLLFKSNTETGRAIAFISPDSERTFATYLGASVELSKDDLISTIFEGYKYFHIEGYLVLNQELVIKAALSAKEKGMIISLDLASFNVVEDNIDFLKPFVKEYVDIVFANEEEAKAFTGKEPLEALKIIAEDCNIAVVKIGKNGSLIKQNNQEFKIDIIPAERKDTTGAGDLYAAGFIYGLVNDLPLDKCGKIGTILSGKVIEVIGAKMDSTRWLEIKEMMKDV